MHIFKFRKAELKTVFGKKKVLYLHNCMFSVFNAIFGHHHLLFDSVGMFSFDY